MALFPPTPVTPLPRSRDGQMPLVWRPHWAPVPPDLTGERTRSEQRLLQSLTPQDPGGLDGDARGSETLLVRLRRTVSVETDVPQLLQTPAGRWGLLTWWLQRQLQRRLVAMQRRGGRAGDWSDPEIGSADFLIEARIQTADMPGAEERERAPAQFESAIQAWTAGDWDRVIPQPLWYRILRAELAELAPGEWTPLLDRLARLAEQGVIAWTPEGVATIQRRITDLAQWLGPAGDPLDTGRLVDRTEAESDAHRVAHAMAMLGGVRLDRVVWPVIRSRPPLGQELTAAIGRATQVASPADWLRPTATALASWGQRDLAELQRQTESEVFHRALVEQRDPTVVEQELQRWVSLPSGGVLNGLVDGPVARYPMLWPTLIKLLLESASWQGAGDFLWRRFRQQFVFPEPLVQALRFPDTPLRSPPGSGRHATRVAFWRAANASATPSDWEPLLHAVARGDMTTHGLRLLLTHPSAHHAALEMVRDATHPPAHSEPAQPDAPEPVVEATASLQEPDASSAAPLGRLTQQLAQPGTGRSIFILETARGWGPDDSRPVDATDAAFSTVPQVVARRRQWVTSHLAEVTRLLLAEPVLPTATEVWLAEHTVRTAKTLEQFLDHQPPRSPEAVAAALGRVTKHAQDVVARLLRGPDAWLAHPGVRAWIRRSKRAQQDGAVLQRLLETAHGTEVGELLGLMATAHPAYVMEALQRRPLPADAVITAAQVRPFALAAGTDPRARERWLKLLGQSPALAAALARGTELGGEVAGGPPASRRSTR